MRNFYIVFACLISINTIAQKSYIRYIVSKDTVQSGEIYNRKIYVDLAKGDSIVDFQVLFYDLKIKIEGHSSKVTFRVRHIGPIYKEEVARREFPLEIRLKTLKVDTVITDMIVYYTRPSPAYVRSLSTQFPYEYEVYPTSKPKLKNYRGDIKHFLCNGLLKGKKGELAFTFMVNTKGFVEYPVIHVNTFPVKKDEILQVLMSTQWTSGRMQNHYVNSLVGEIIEMK